jgi:hypothetical protein
MRSSSFFRDLSESLYAPPLLISAPIRVCFALIAVSCPTIGIPFVGIFGIVFASFLERHAIAFDSLCKDCNYGDPAFISFLTSYRRPAFSFGDLWL